jgi:DNA polymerase III epsilon subunit-like protein
VIDLETTGLDVKTAELTEIATLQVPTLGPTVLDANYVRCPIPIPPEVVQLNGITNETCAALGLDPIAALHLIAVQTMTFRYIVGHNVLRYELPLLTSLLARYLPESKYPHLTDIDRYLDTAAVFKARKVPLHRLPGESWGRFGLRVLEYHSRHKYNLGFACREMGLFTDDVNLHRAGDDVVMTRALLEKLWAEALAGRS